MRSFSRSIVLSASLLTGLTCSLPSAPAAQIFSGNVLWFRADQGVLNASALPAGDTNPVATWEDQSSSGFDVEQTISGKRPVFVASSSLNSQPAILFDNSGGAGGADSLSNTLNNALSNTSARTVLSAGQAGASSAGGSLFTFRRTTLVNTNSLWNTGGTFYVYSDGVNGSGNSTIPNPALATLTEIRAPFVSVHKSTPGTTPTLTPIGVDLNGTLRPVTTGGGGVTSETGSTGFSVGGRLDQPAGATDWGGLIGEVQVYDRVLNTAETVIATNSLSAKYGTALAGNDKYTGDDPGKNNYDFEVFGIGMDAATANGSPAGSVTSGTAGTGLSLAQANSSLSNGDFLLAGQRVGTNSLTTSDVPSGLGSRWNRVWYLEQTGALDATLTFDFSDSGLTIPSESNAQFSLLFSTSDPFAFNQVVTPATKIGDQISFTLSTGQLQNGYYTLAVLIPIPEPGTFALAGLGLLALRRKNKQTADSATESQEIPRFDIA